MRSISATGEYGLIVRRDALRAKFIADALVLQAMEVDAPLDMDEDLMSFGPAFGDEALQEFVRRLRTLGLSPVDDFCTLCLDLPNWCRINVGLSRE
ncbi:hypothetical protein [Stenotrophomonas sp. PS02300]|uniref:hypothetical protein n=1 Tax=Stenotrophomonas sp. PS02300 TaxID=2991426 RepID=UPI00249A3FCD|nr:hypothetical protein [Stenotrophomonas sp. PS02300]